jgi:hypothetical protein
MTKGNLLILFKTLPSNFGIYFIKLSDATKISNGFAHFLIGFFSLLNFFKPSTSIEAISNFLACSQCYILPITPIYSFFFLKINKKQNLIFIQNII